MEVTPYVLEKRIQIILIAINSRVLFIFKNCANDSGYLQLAVTGAFTVSLRCICSVNLRYIACICIQHSSMSF